jgi:hypothetical protein
VNYKKCIVSTKFAVTVKKVSKQTEQTKNQVLFLRYDMNSLEVRWIRNTDKYDAKQDTVE